jgi:hypothetical protein
LSVTYSFSRPLLVMGLLLVAGTVLVIVGACWSSASVS